MTGKFIILFCLFSFFGRAQANKKEIRQHFNFVEYYPDSTFKAVYHLKRNKFRGYSIEFDTLGEAIWIGKYRNGLKHGVWRKWESSHRFYRRGEWDIQTRQGCGTQINKSMRKFQKLYLKLIGISEPI